MKSNRKNTENVLIDLSYMGSMNQFEELNIQYIKLESEDNAMAALKYIGGFIK